jgi:hypothetical protein
MNAAPAALVRATVLKNKSIRRIRRRIEICH